jgi:aminoacyl tRNA synthase complex-interacting multifunctional protein 1
MKAANCPNVLRWFDLVQNNVVKANELTNDFPIFEINLDDVAAAAAAVPGVSFHEIIVIGKKKSIWF